MKLSCSKRVWTNALFCIAVCASLNGINTYGPGTTLAHALDDFALPVDETGPLGPAAVVRIIPSIMINGSKFYNFLK